MNGKDLTVEMFPNDLLLLHRLGLCQRLEGEEKEAERVGGKRKKTARHKLLYSYM